MGPIPLLPMVVLATEVVEDSDVSFFFVLFFKKKENLNRRDSETKANGKTIGWERGLDDCRRNRRLGVSC